MPQRFSIRSRLAAVIAAGFVGAATLVWAAPADDFREAQKLYGQGKVQPALEKVEAFLKAQPRDPQGRFLKGILLTELKRAPEAIQMFTGLTEDFPELPEPYNNLAVLYAQQGNYDKAKAALELAIHTHPSYATAHENLGDVYAQLASRAYDRALQLDKNNTTAQSKLALVKELFSSSRSGGQRPEASRAAASARAEAAKAAPPPATTAAAEPARVAVKPETKAPAPAAKAPEPAKTTPAPAKAEPAKAAPAAASVTPAANDEKARITAAIEAWARAWSAKDVKSYLAAYAPEFDPPGKMSRAAWEKQRTERIEAPKSISVDVKVSSIEVSGNEATAVIRQAYRSDTLKSDNTKTLKLLRSGDRWLITQERVGG
ncbi:MAG TPA: tetratricopeptide repeat protein [Usitatibacter sp.]|nr:tetratricopeptide repeat protein [Usitatibacter sp.]